MSVDLSVPEKPDWRCLCGIHSWEKYTSGAEAYRRCRRCEKIDSSYMGTYGCRWETVVPGKVLAWSKYQEKLAHSRLSPDLKDYVDKVQVNEHDPCNYFGRKE